MAKRKIFFTIIAGVMVLSGSAVVLSHCEIPCGIYDDEMRLDMMAEHATTIEKGIRQIQMLTGAEDKNHNQIVRWVMNKEHHADALSDIVTEYFMKQRIKPVTEGRGRAYEQYVHKLTLLHAMMVDSMKCKQTTNLQHVENLRAHLSAFRKAYMDEHGHEH